MCGIAGIISASRLDERDVRRLIDPIAHRGPDDDGVWVDPEAGVGLGHRRLSIIDLSPAGHQPMTSADGRYVITHKLDLHGRSVRFVQRRNATFRRKFQRIQMSLGFGRVV
jgi:asparagine synthase (glutamine-hydrolysing)